MLLFQSVIYFRLTPLISLKNRFGDLALVIRHKSPSANRVLPAICGVMQFNAAKSYKFLTNLPEIR